MPSNIIMNTTRRGASRLSRRALLRQGLQLGTSSVLGAGLASAVLQRQAGAAEIAGGEDPRGLLAGKNPRPARACILLYMAGGPSHIDTFDPKPGRPGGGTFKPIATRIDGIQISEHLPRLAARMQQLALIRSLTSKEGNHDRARHLMHTSYPPAGGADHPAFGSLVAEARAARAAGLPGYVSIGGPGEDSGFLSSALSPFPVKNALRPVRHLTPARGVDGDRFDDRLALWRKLEDRYAAGGGGKFAASRREVTEQALTLMRSTGVQAFQVDAEPDAVKQAYGGSEFGAGCLMARRLVEAGVPFVEVTLNGWDTHEDVFARVKALSATLDQGMSALLDDLLGRGLLESTLVVWMGDFGRTPRINEKGGRDHHPAASSVLLAGGGVKGGQAIGSTDVDGAEVRDRPVTVPDLYRTIAHVLDLNPDKQRTSPAGRPIKSVETGTIIPGLI
jgi:hypothetical protein